VSFSSATIHLRFGTVKKFNEQSNGGITMRGENLSHVLGGLLANAIVTNKSIQKKISLSLANFIYSMSQFH